MPNTPQNSKKLRLFSSTLQRAAQGVPPWSYPSQLFCPGSGKPINYLQGPGPRHFTRWLVLKPHCTISVRANPAE